MEKIKDLLSFQLKKQYCAGDIKIEVIKLMMMMMKMLRSSKMIEQLLQKYRCLSHRKKW